MHRFTMPSWAVDRVVARAGRPHPFDTLDPRRTALVVIDLQNAFMMDGVAHNPVQTAREIVPAVNRTAAALRDAGGAVVWIQTSATDAVLEAWSVYYELSSPERGAQRSAALRPGSIGHQLWADLDVRPADLKVEKTRFSAFIEGSSDLERVLRERGIDTVLIAGTVTGVCCESSARDAMMRNFRVVMLSDGNAAKTDAEHEAALVAFYLNFGDVMETGEAIACLQAAEKRDAA
jgi:ureidoacrylate peracid hydrolase